MSEQPSGQPNAPDTGLNAIGNGVSRELPIINKRGLHARASAKFVQLVERYAGTDVSVSRNGETVGGTSIMGLMMLSAGIGTSVHVTCKGPQEIEVMDALTALLANKFGEEE